MNVSGSKLIPAVPARRSYRPESIVRVVMLAMLVCLIAAACVGLFGTEQGRRLMDEGSQASIGRDVHSWVGEHPLLAPLMLVAAYTMCSLLALPVWWLQILAGYGFGLLFGVTWCQLGGVVGSIVTVTISRWLGASWFQEKIEARMHKLRSLDESLGHNGFLVVLVMRLLPILPFGLSNYAIGLTRIAITPVALGTYLGLVPIVTFYVALGAKPSLVKSKWFWAAWVAAHLVMLVPLAIRFSRVKSRTTSGLRN